MSERMTMKGNEEIFLKTFKEYKGSIAKTLKALGIKRPTYYSYVGDHAEFRKRIQEIQDENKEQQKGKPPPKKIKAENNIIIDEPKVFLVGDYPMKKVFGGEVIDFLKLTEEQYWNIKDQVIKGIRENNFNEGLTLESLKINREDFIAMMGDRSFLDACNNLRQLKLDIVESSYFRIAENGHAGAMKVILESQATRRGYGKTILNDITPKEANYINVLRNGLENIYIKNTLDVVDYNDTQKYKKYQKELYYKDRFNKSMSEAWENAQSCLTEQDSIDLFSPVIDNSLLPPENYEKHDAINIERKFDIYIDIRNDFIEKFVDNITDNKLAEILEVVKKEIGYFIPMDRGRELVKKSYRDRFIKIEYS